MKRQEGMHVCADARQYKVWWVLMCGAHDIASRNYTNVYLRRMHDLLHRDGTSRPYC
jgi:hypothetical protein